MVQFHGNYEKYGKNEKYGKYVQMNAILHILPILPMKR